MMVVGVGAARRRRVCLWVLIWLIFASCEKRQIVESFPEEFVGVGLELTMQGPHAVVVRTLKSGPAYVAGMQEGDTILGVDGFATENMSLGDVVMRLRGPPDTQVQLNIKRGADAIVVILRRQRMAKITKGYEADQ